MINDLPTRCVDLTLPRGWNQCTTVQLEMIADTLLRHTLVQDRYHPFSWVQVKTELFFLLAGLEVLKVSGGRSASQLPQDTFMVRLADRRPWHKRLFSRHPCDPFPLYAWQVQSFVEQHLKWLDDEKAAPRQLWPYPRLLGSWRLSLRFPFVRRCWLSPSELLQDFTWQQYRYLQDYMELYVSLHNRQVKAPGDRSALYQARNSFLAVLFHCEKRPALVRRISAVQWQVVLFWWSGMMHYLKQQFPHCFKQSSQHGRKRPPLPIELYTSIVTTVQKESNGLTEDEVNAQTFYIVLEHLERLAKQSEEIEKMNRKTKNK